jgi:hypothetical protein
MNKTLKWGAIAMMALFNYDSLQAQCATDNSICVGVQGDCQGQIYSNPYGTGTVEFTSGVKTVIVNGYKFETFNVEAQVSGKVEANTNATYARQNGDSIKCSIWKPPIEDSARGEIGTGAIDTHAKKDANGNDYYYWYGWSYYIPNDTNWSSPTLRQFIGQWRFYNGVNGENCVTMKECSSAKVGGSGHHLMLDNGRLILTLAIDDTSCATAGRLKVIKLDLGTPVKGKWMDFMFQVRWTETASGSLKAWIQKDNSGYTQVANYTGPTWIKKYNANTTCPSNWNGKLTGSPGWQLGLYWANERPATEAAARFIYVDAARCNRTICSTGKGSETWSRTLPAAEGTIAPTKVVDLDTLSYTTSSGDSVSSFADATNATGGTALSFSANAIGDYCQTSFSVATAGTYNIKLRAKKYTARGTAAFFVNGTQLGSTWDQYSTAANDWFEVDYGSTALVAGTNTFKWVITGKNTSSTAYDYTLDKLTLTP